MEQNEEDILKKIKEIEEKILDIIIPNKYKSDVYQDIYKNGITLNNLNKVLDTLQDTWLNNYYDNFHKKEYVNLTKDVHNIIMMRKELEKYKKPEIKKKNIFQKIFDMFKFNEVRE